jgi:hypothetical protein
MHPRGEVFGGTFLGSVARSQRYRVILFALVLLVIVVFATTVCDKWNDHQEDLRNQDATATAAAATQTLPD